MSQRGKSEFYREYFNASRPISFVVCFGEMCSEKVPRLEGRILVSLISTKISQWDFLFRKIRSAHDRFHFDILLPFVGLEGNRTLPLDNFEFCFRFQGLNLIKSQSFLKYCRLPKILIHF
jgi:hypothetical protein